MLHLTLKGKEDTIAVLYNSTHELPMYRWVKLQQWLDIDTYIGGDEKAVERHKVRIAHLEEEGKASDALVQRRLLNNCEHHIKNGIHPFKNAFASLVYSVGGEVYDDMVDLDRVIKKLEQYEGFEDLMHKTMNNILEVINSEQKYVNPEEIPHDINEDLLIELTRQYRAILNHAITDEAKYADMEKEAADWVYNKVMKPPRLFLELADNEIHEMERRFIDLCTTLRLEGITQPDRLSVFEYNRTVLFLEKRYEKYNK